MYKKLGSIFGIFAVLAALLFSVPATPASAANYDLFTGMSSSITTVNVGTGYEAYQQINNNTGSALTAHVRLSLPQGMFRNLGATGVGVTGLSCVNTGYRIVDCTFTLASFSTGYVKQTVFVKVCYPAVGTLNSLLYTGTYPSSYTQLAIASANINGGTGRLGCLLDITPSSGYDVVTAEARNTNYYEEVEFTINYSSGTSGWFEAGITNSGKATFNQWPGAIDKLDLWVDPGSVFIQDCPTGGGHTFGDCTYTGWQSGKTGIIGADYHVGNTAGSDKKFYRFYKTADGTLQFEELVDVTVT